MLALLGFPWHSLLLLEFLCRPDGLLFFVQNSPSKLYTNCRVQLNWLNSKHMFLI
ncbi:hypothetical protein PFLA_b1186 [Pseudoalteromonas flavipulchra NCIMB 2033 = ATCC BAA-314]|nr:hypothetical protein [Pseudoalteromonas flavipulchra NCIMB 2033 = ATCC BAA-314]